MLSDEEKILIKKLGYCEQEYEQNGYLSVGKFEAIKEAINLIEKQQKEIEEAKQKEKQAYKFGYNNGCNDTSKFNDKNFIRVDKIKAKMKEKEWSLENYDCIEADYKQSQAVGAWNVLQLLLKESEI